MENITLYNPNGQNEQNIITGHISAQSIEDVAFIPLVNNQYKFDFDFCNNAFSQNELIIDHIFFENYFYYLKRSIKFNSSFENGLIILYNKEFDLRVWGTSKKEVIEALHFNFHALYTNFVLEDDNILSEKSKDIKKKLIELVAFVF